MSKNISWNSAVMRILKDSDDALTTLEIADRIVAAGLRESYGATPQATVAATISNSMTRLGKRSPYVRVARGEYAVRHQKSASPNLEETSQDVDDDENRAGGVQALGMYWARDAVNWTRKTKLLGKQQIGADPVDVSRQVGVYLLYDLREVIYVGRSIDRPIGVRLYEHTQDRLRARWNRFSWFGLQKIASDGKQASEIPNINPEDLIRSMEAVLIEAMEPRQNRKRGDDFSGIEFIQEVDPGIERQRALDILR